jgi:ABC-type antimicrobial peptide transport system permease subunit
MFQVKLCGFLTGIFLGLAVVMPLTANPDLPTFNIIIGSAMFLLSAISIGLLGYQAVKEFDRKKEMEDYFNNRGCFPR